MNFNSEGATTVLWKNETPNSAFTCRPQALIRGKEDKTLVQYDLDYAEREQAVLESSPTTVVSTRFPVSSKHYICYLSDLYMCVSFYLQ